MMASNTDNGGQKKTINIGDTNYLQIADVSACMVILPSNLDPQNIPDIARKSDADGREGCELDITVGRAKTTQVSGKDAFLMTFDGPPAPNEDTSSGHHVGADHETSYEKLYPYPVQVQGVSPLEGQLDTGQASADHTGAGPLSPPDQVPPAVQSTRVDHMASCVQGHGMHGVDKPHFHVINGSSCVQIGDSCTCVSINISNDLVQYVKSQGILTVSLCEGHSLFTMKFASLESKKEYIRCGLKVELQPKILETVEGLQQELMQILVQNNAQNVQHLITHLLESYKCVLIDILYGSMDFIFLVPDVKTKDTLYRPDSLIKITMFLEGLLISEGMKAKARRHHVQQVAFMVTPLDCSLAGDREIPPSAVAAVPTLSYEMTRSLIENIQKMQETVSQHTSLMQSMQRSVMSIPQEVQRLVSQEVQKSVSHEVVKSVSLEVLKSVSQELQESVSREMQRSLSQEVQKSGSREMQRSLSQEVQKSGSREMQRSLSQEMQVVKPRFEQSIMLSQEQIIREMIHDGIKPVQEQLTEILTKDKRESVTLPKDTRQDSGFADLHTSAGLNTSPDPTQITTQSSGVLVVPTETTAVQRNLPENSSSEYITMPQIPHTPAVMPTPDTYHSEDDRSEDGEEDEEEENGNAESISLEQTPVPRELSRPQLKQSFASILELYSQLEKQHGPEVGRPDMSRKYRACHLPLSEDLAEAVRCVRKLVQVERLLDLVNTADKGVQSHFQASGLSTILCLDVSRSIKGTPLSRLIDCVKVLRDDIDDNAANWKLEENVGVVLFGGGVEVALYPTNDYQTVAEAVDAEKLSCHGDTSPMLEAIITSILLLHQKDYDFIIGEKAQYLVCPRIILLTDGLTTEGSDNPDAESTDIITGEARDALCKYLPVILSASDRKVKINCVPLGNFESHLPVQILSCLSEVTSADLIDPTDEGRTHWLGHYFRRENAIGKVLEWYMTREEEPEEDELDSQLLEEYEASGINVGQADVKHEVLTYIEEMRRRNTESDPQGDRRSADWPTPKVGDQVRPGRDWDYGKVGGVEGPPTCALVIQYNRREQTVKVRWDGSRREDYYRYGDGRYEVELIQPALREEMNIGGEPDLQVDCDLDQSDEPFACGAAVMPAESLMYGGPPMSRSISLPTGATSNRHDRGRDHKMVWQRWTRGGNWQLFSSSQIDTIEKAYTSFDKSCVVIDEERQTSYCLDFVNQQCRDLSNNVSHEDIRRREMAMEEYETCTRTTNQS